MADSQEQLQTAVDGLRKLEQELQASIQARQKLESQQQENKTVQKEFESLGDDAKIYKLVGPVLLRQDKTEASLAIDSRLEFIEKEIQRVEKQIAELQEKSQQKKMEVVQARSASQEQAQAAA